MRELVADAALRLLVLLRLLLLEEVALLREELDEALLRLLEEEVAVWLRQRGIWWRKSFHEEFTSPDQVLAPVRCWPAKYERVRMKTRLSDVSAL